MRKLAEKRQRTETLGHTWMNDEEKEVPRDLFRFAVTNSLLTDANWTTSLDSRGRCAK